MKAEGFEGKQVRNVPGKALGLFQVPVKAEGFEGKQGGFFGSLDKRALGQKGK